MKQFCLRFQVTNVKVAAEFREKDRHDRLDEAKKERYERLHQEADECEAMYKEIEGNWFVAAEKILPLELYEKVKWRKITKVLTYTD